MTIYVSDPATPRLWPRNDWQRGRASLITAGGLRSFSAVPTTKFLRECRRSNDPMRQQEAASILTK